MDKEQLIILREIVWQLNKHDPKVLTKILEIMDTKTETLNKVMEQLDKETVDVHDVEKWPWIECPKCGFGQRADPKLLAQGAKPYCPDCKIEMEVRPEPMEERVDWHVSTNPLIDQSRTTVSITKPGSRGRIYAIQVCPTVSLSVWLNKEEAAKQGSNHHIFGTIQINNAKDFDDLWNAIVEALEKRKDMHHLWTRLRNI